MHYLELKIKGRRHGILYVTAAAYAVLPRDFLTECAWRDIKIEIVARSDKRRNTFVFQQDSEHNKS